MRTRATVAALAVATGLLLAPQASAQLSLSAQSTASFSVTLDGTDKTGTYTLALTVTDSRSASQARGWRLTVTSTTFSTGGGTPRLLPTDASQITGATHACVSSCTSAPSNSVTYPVAVPAGTSAPSAVRFYNAASGTGRGTWRVTPTIAVSVPANTLTGAYVSTVTTSVVAGP